MFLGLLYLFVQSLSAKRISDYMFYTYVQIPIIFLLSTTRYEHEAVDALKKRVKLEPIALRKLKCVHSLFTHTIILILPNLLQHRK